MTQRATFQAMLPGNVMIDVHFLGSEYSVEMVKKKKKLSVAYSSSVDGRITDKHNGEKKHLIVSLPRYIA